MFENYSKSSVKESYEFSLYMRKKLVAVMICVFGIFFACGIGLAFISLYGGVFLAIFSGCMVIFYAFFFRASLKKNVEKLAAASSFIGEDVVNYYLFYEDYFQNATLKAGFAVGNAAVRYIDLTKVVDCGGYLFLFIANNQAYILDKSGNTRNDFPQLADFLRAKLGEKYIFAGRKKGAK